MPTTKTRAAHTPGPWHRNIKPASKYTIVWAGRNTHVAHIVVGREMSEDELEANINLIAAAPELLSALKAWEEAEAMTVGDGRDFDARRAAKQQAKVQAHQMMRAAIAKAEGRP